MHKDDDDQRKLRALLDELAEICRKHDVGGSLLLVSSEAAAWKHVLPSWLALRTMPHGFVVEIRGSTREGHERTVNTMHFLGSLRDMASDCANVYGRLFRQAQSVIRDSGGEVTHVPFGGSEGSGRIDPEGGKHD